MMHLFDPQRPQNNLGPMLVDPQGRVLCNVPPLHTDPRPEGGFCVRAYLPTHGYSNSYTVYELEVASLDTTYADYVADPEAFVKRLGFSMMAPKAPRTIAPEELFDD